MESKKLERGKQQYRLLTHFPLSFSATALVFAITPTGRPVRLFPVPFPDRPTRRCSSLEYSKLLSINYQRSWNPTWVLSFSRKYSSSISHSEIQHFHQSFRNTVLLSVIQKYSMYFYQSFEVKVYTFISHSKLQYFWSSQSFEVTVLLSVIQTYSYSEQQSFVIQRYSSPNRTSVKTEQ